MSPARSEASPAVWYQQWKTLRDLEAPLPRFSEAYNFLKSHPGWPQERIIRARAEAAALLERSGDTQSFCTQFPPVTGRGMIACLQSGAGDAATRNDWLHQAWLNGDFNDDEERRILAAYGGQLKPAEHRARTDRLLYDGKTTQAKRMLPRIAPQYQLLAEARIALIDHAHNAVAKLHNVPQALRNDPGLMLSRIEWRAKQGLEDGVVELFLEAPANPPYADRWWNLRASAAREALKEKKYDAALTILARHGDLRGENLADALFLKGWIRMEFKNDMRTAYKDFYSLYKETGTPVSKARAAYWAGRAASRNGNEDIAMQWYRIGARHPTVFYGQLSRAALIADSQTHPVAPKANPAEKDAPAPVAALQPLPDRLELSVTPAMTEAARKAVEGSELAQVLPLAKADDARRMLPLFLKAMVDRANSPEEIAVIAELAQRNASITGAVKVAKHALRKQIVLVKAGWPIIALPDAIGTEPALTLAIARQESEFDPVARSGADARGLMQLLPGTGAHMAKKLDLKYRASDLWEPKRNMTLGSHYLGRLVDGFDGSYILAIASYNAGPANVRKWVDRNGWPPKDEAGAVDWVESIPYAETRNYVMRVLENLQIYRQLRDPEHPLDLAHDLTR